MFPHINKRFECQKVTLFAFSFDIEKLRKKINYVSAESLIALSNLWS